MRVFVTDATGLMARIASLGDAIEVPARALASVVAGRWCARRAWFDAASGRTSCASLLDEFASTRATTSMSVLRDPGVDLDVTLSLWPHPSRPDELVLVHVECEHDELVRLVAGALELVEDDQAHPCLLDPDYPRLTYRLADIELDADACAAEMLRYGGARLGLDSIAEAKAVLLGAPFEMNAERSAIIASINEAYDIATALALGVSGDTSGLVAVLSERETAYARELGRWND